GDVHRLLPAGRRVRQARAQGLALEQLRDRIEEVSLAAEVVERQDVGMRERRDRSRFVLEAPGELRVARETLRQHLDRNLASEPGVPRAVDLAHPARAERAEDLVGTEAGARRQSQRAGLCSSDANCQTEGPAFS